MTEIKRPGYDDTPLVPGSTFKVHDPQRPWPRVVTPPSASTQDKAGTPPSDAVILFDGSSLSGWTHRDGAPCRWRLDNGYMEVAPRTGDIFSRDQFGDCQLHVEWAAPAEVVGESQGRGNSGVFLMGRYEVQVLDCYQNMTYADGTTAAIYGQYPPLVNACRKPGDWQTYDIVWMGPRFEGNRLIRTATLTVFQNGLLIHHAQPLIGPTTHKTVIPYVPHPVTGPLQLQDHGNPVRFRNIWYRRLTAYDEV